MPTNSVKGTKTADCREPKGGPAVHFAVTVAMHHHCQAAHWLDPERQSATVAYYLASAYDRDLSLDPQILGGKVIFQKFGGACPPP